MCMFDIVLNMKSTQQFRQCPPKGPGNRFSVPPSANRIAVQGFSAGLATVPFYIIDPNTGVAINLSQYDITGNSQPLTISSHPGFVSGQLYFDSADAVAYYVEVIAPPEIVAAAFSSALGV